MPAATMRAMNSSGFMVKLPLLMVSTKLAAEYYAPIRSTAPSQALAC